MKKEGVVKNIIIIVLAVLLVASIVATIVIAVNKNKGPDDQGILVEPKDANIIAVEGGIVESNVSLSVGHGESVNLPAVLAISEGATWELYKDEGCQESLAKDADLGLQDGENIFFVIVKSEDGKKNN
ncbi:MAG TPA: hypothetical protein PKX91_05375 [Clostridia bacterium]|jgi:hypothetical protein|nr:hypothetical protein [Clostridia bacterium]